MWRPDALGSHGERGLFQIHPMNNHRFDIAGLELDATDPLHNASAALAIWELYGWEPWTCRPG
jgi:SLT domain-containing protein